MNPSFQSFLRPALLLLCGSAVLPCALPVGADEHKAPPVRSGDAQARRLTISRLGYAGARPDSATLEMPFRIEGDTSADLERKRAELLRALEKSVATYEPKGDAGRIFVAQSQSGQAARDGKLFMQEAGNIHISVRNLAHLPEIYAALSKQTEARVALRYQIAVEAHLEKAREQAALNAIASARRQADLLANAAGTRIIGVWELNEGEVNGVESELVVPEKSGTLRIPEEIAVFSARVTIVYELAPAFPAPPQSKPRPR